MVETLCDKCVLSKQTRLPFEKYTLKVKSILNYIHLDLLGPSRTKTFSNCIYFLAITDVFSRYRWTFLLRVKTYVFECFKIWKNAIENEKGEKSNV